MAVEGIDTVRAIDRMLTVFDQQQSINENVLRMVKGLDELDDRRAAAILELREGMAALDELRAADLFELREGLAALSNRIESLTRYVMDAEAGPHSVKA